MRGAAETPDLLVPAHDVDGSTGKGSTDPSRHPSRWSKTVPSEIVRMLGELVHEVQRDHADLSTERDDGVILDADVEGIRCLLIRRPVSSVGATVRLSPREREIARMVAKGYPNKAIAAVLEISSWTVGTHLRHIFAKLGVSTRAAMVAKLPDVTRIGPPIPP